MWVQFDHSFIHCRVPRGSLCSQIVVCSRTRSISWTSGRRGRRRQSQLMNAGAFTSVDAALMIHLTPPINHSDSKAAGISYGTCLAACGAHATFIGKETSPRRSLALAGHQRARCSRFGVYRSLIAEAAHQTARSYQYHPPRRRYRSHCFTGSMPPPYSHVYLLDR